MKVSVRQLFRMKKEDMLRLAAEWGVENVGDKRREELFKMLRDRLAAGIELPAAAVREPGNKELFKELTAETDPAGPVQADTPEPGPDEKVVLEVDARGGARPGAGRKIGKTNEQCKIDNLSKEPNLTVQYAVKWIFKFWARLADCPEIVLDEEELQEFSVDTTQFLEWHHIKIPQGLAIDGKFIGGGLELFGGRVAILKAHKARLKKQKEQEAEPQPQQGGSGI